jgi:uroporphyrinogen decarboxylase
MFNRREFFLSAAAGFAPRHKPKSKSKPAAAGKVTPRERVDRVLAGRTPDRTPFTFWHHFHDEKEPGVKHASLTLEFARRFRLDIAKVMSDYPYPKAEAGEWYELKVQNSPFPEQIRALELIRDGLSGQKHFVETVFNPWSQATKISSKAAIAALMREKPQALLDALEIIAKSEANHVKLALEAGASGIFLAIDNVAEGGLSAADYHKFSEPFDRLVLDAAAGAPLNVLHLHGAKVHLGLFWKGWANASAINYSAHENIPLAEARKHTSAVLMGGLDHRSVVGASTESVQRMLKAAHAAAPRWICTPGCSVPDESKGAHLLKLARTLGAHIPQRK